MKCENCKHARLAVSEEARKEYVGCVKTDGIAYEDQKKLFDFLDKIEYTGKTVATGWIYTTYPNQGKPENGQMFSTCLLVEKKAKCKNFSKR